MKGKLHKSNDGWVVKFDYMDDQYSSYLEFYTVELPITPKSYCDNLKDSNEGLEVEFNFIKNNQDNVGKLSGFAKIKEPFIPQTLNDEEIESPYCPVCDGCGEEGCCSPVHCQQSPNGHYCKTYLKDLKFGYLMYDQIMELIGDDEKYKEQIDKLWDETYEKIYRNE
jgi:hypothetical protein